MSVGKYLRGSGLAALAASMIVTAVPAAAQSGGRNPGDRTAAERAEDGSQSRNTIAYQARAQRVAQRAERIDTRSERRAAQVDNRTEQRAARIERQGDRAAQQ